VASAPGLPSRQETRRRTGRTAGSFGRGGQGTTRLDAVWRGMASLPKTEKPLFAVHHRTVTYSRPPSWPILYMPFDIPMPVGIYSTNTKGNP
jgi:hypothetical protein